jgi:hypothetical protein
MMMGIQAQARLLAGAQHKSGGLELSLSVLPPISTTVVGIRAVATLF